MKNRNLKVGIIGAGAISEYHLRAWNQSSDAVLSAITDINLEQAKEKAEAFFIPSVYENAEEMLNNESLDAVDIITPVQTHVPLTKLCADKGIDVICQKPLAATAKEAKELVEYCQGKIRVMVHENTRFKPHFLSAKQVIDRGVLGKIVRVNLTVRSSGYFRENNDKLPFYLNRQPYLSDFKNLLIFESLIHHVDVLISLFGKLDVDYASATNINTRDLSGEDTALVVFKNKDNVVITLDGSFAAAGSPSLPTDTLEILGENGRVIITNTSITVSDGGSTSIEEIMNDYCIPFETATHHFIHCLINGDEFSTSAFSNLLTIETVEKIYKNLSYEKL
ncbi:Gfo/Idh/MocA family oxidoreductase [Parasalinivibrio latis]|uniref:Gfo/Idh/MocA family protein n=1 Tax=Parasalinivibrio latis TaxID=2952610 RepID=UPI0030E124D2